MSEFGPEGLAKAAEVVPEPAAVRLNYLDLTRATEQTAIITNLMLGVAEHRGGAAPRRELGAHRRDWAERLAISSMMGYLYQSWCNGKIVQSHPRRDRIRDLWGSIDAPVGRYAGQGELGLDLEFVISPCEGMRDLLHGCEGGSLSILAGGPPDSFRASGAVVQDGGGIPEWYFVLTMPGQPNIACGVLDSEIGLTGEQVLAEIIEETDLIRSLLARSAKKPKELTIATMELDQPSRVLAALRKYARLRLFHGSSVAAAISPYFPRLAVDIFAGVLDHTSTLLVAAAARGMGCDFCALPGCRGKSRGMQNRTAFRVLPGKGFCRAEDFAPGDDIFIVASGITESILLRGVRFAEEARVSTHTMCLRSRTKSQRLISQYHYLEAKRFRLLERSDEHNGAHYHPSAYRDMGYEDILRDVV